MKVIATLPEYDIKWSVEKGLHTVQYYKQVKTFVNDLQAAEEFGHCVRHAAECKGLLD
jgi:hypothetical protein